MVGKRGHSYPGLFVTFDGPDGSGKTTQCRMFNDYLDREGYVVGKVREPGGTSIGEQVRKILLEPENSEMSLATEFFLYEAARAQLMFEKIQPFLEAGEIVIADRFFDATIAYQGGAGGIPLDLVMYGNSVASQGIFPDRSYFFDVSSDVAASRMYSEFDRMEQKGVEYHDRVRKAFLGIANLELDRVKVIDSNESDVHAIHREVCEDYKAYLNSHGLENKLVKVEQNA